ncbi:ABC transporter ATP-binding protein [Vibrio sp. HA2012]|uniref:ABC transporter ATP-binding protein n=1 Tax=Vibrio sp. HA2012 TaxID=1971595 RepID=UPI0018E1ECC3|nr:ABC transporter ATP-binding protein [Vibrio sp. HA2012]
MKTNPIKLLLKVSSPEKTRLTIAGLLVFISSACSIGPYYIAFLLLDKIVHPPFVLNDFFTYGLIATLFIIAQLVFSGIAMTVSHIAAYNILFDLRVKLANKMLRLPLGYFGKTTSGEIKKIMMEDIEAIEGFVAHNLVDMFSVIFIPLLIFLWLLTFNIPLAMISILPVVLGITLQQYRVRRDADDFNQFAILKGKMNRTIIDFIRGMPVIKAFNQTVFSFNSYTKEVDTYSNFWIGMNKRAAGVMVLYALLMDGGILLILPIGGFMYLYGQLSLTDFLMFMFLGIGLTRFMKQITGFVSNINQISRGVNVLNRVLNNHELNSNGLIKNIDNYDIKFRDVSFGYGDKKVINNVNFSTKQGNMTALVGPSGAGKTTVGRLISRFWDVDDGSITIGGVNVRDIDSTVLMNKVSFVFQDVFMFNDTVLENIRMWDKSISRNKVIEIAKKAQCHDFIMHLEDGYDTQLGVKGTYLSGGEKQRISIARALCKDSPIIILDEATSYADTENEAQIQSALSVLLEGKTVLIIAHRLSTIQHADQILVFKNGEISEKGTHAQLLEKRGVYKKMWDNYIDANDWGIKNTINTEIGVA